MNLSQTDYLDDELPDETDPHAQKRNHRPDLGRLRIGDHPETGLETVAPSPHQEEHQMEDGGKREHAYCDENGDENQEYEEHEPCGAMTEKGQVHGHQPPRKHEKFPEEAEHGSCRTHQETEGEGLANPAPDAQ